MAAYATGADMFKRYDTDLLCRLLTDTHAPIARSDAVTHENMVFALESASGQFETALLHGKRYAVSDLAGLTGNAAAYATDIVCCLAIVRLLNRKANSYGEFAQAMAKQAREYIDFLQSGKDVFNLETQVNAGVIAHKVVDESIVLARDLRSDNLRGRLFAQE